MQKNKINKTNRRTNPEFDAEIDLRVKKISGAFFPPLQSTFFFESTNKQLDTERENKQTN